jgi:hypothetical protein
MTTIEKSIEKLESNNRSLRESLVTSWAALAQNESALSALKEAVQSSLAGGQPEAKPAETEKALQDGMAATAQS